MGRALAAALFWTGMFIYLAWLLIQALRAGNDLLAVVLFLGALTAIANARAYVKELS